MAELHFTDSHLLALHSELAHLRIKADLTLLPKLPYFADKPYPLGRCKEIRDEVFVLLQESLKNPQTDVLKHIRAYLDAGGELKKAWGSLRDEYFQNVIVAGDWYLDVSNDTVHPNKPRVEILKLAEANFQPITDYSKFIAIAKKYWHVDVYANTVLPALAPYFPLVCVNSKGASWLAAANDDMLKVVMGSDFQQSEMVLTDLPSVAPPLHLAWQQMIAAQPSSSPFFAMQQSGLEYCQHYRAMQYAKNIEHRNAAVIAFLSLPSAVSVKTTLR